MNPRFQRLALITGAETIELLAQTTVAIVGLGGVGSWCAEALVRSGLANLVLIDSDTVCITNINRQVQATGLTIGQPKVLALEQRLLAINPDCTVKTFEAVFKAENAGLFCLEKADYIIDAIDSIQYKLDLIETAFSVGSTVFSSMGTAQKLDPTRLKVADIWQTSVCPLARLVRSGLRARGFHHSFPVVYSEERLPLHAEQSLACGLGQCLCPARRSPDAVDWCSAKKIINGSAVTVTASAGMILASLVMRDLAAKALPSAL
ncbi:MAG: tRNA threonylcarbamoyladenosine dehydratase [Spirochaetaceae bacterium]|jgi:tRNA A37 threonylcarbamoyladenosine dehydratase|nr:tRNA threonylcarbamoyladenosine dehydratase [Spirochaetaceae bacterium]